MGDTTDLVSQAYFGELSELPVMTPGQERELAESIVQAEVDGWCAVLSSPAPAQRALAELDRWLGEEEILPELEQFRGVQHGSDAWNDCARALGLRMRLLDGDRSCWRYTLNWACAEPDAEYCQRVRAADRRQRREKDAFVKANLRLVLSVARRYRRSDVEFMDIVQEGNMGLIKGVEKFDHTLGFRFSTYATWWIRHAIGRAIEEQRGAVRVPMHTAAAQRRLRRAADKHTLVSGQEATPADLEAATGIAADKVERIGFAVTSISLDKPLSAGGEGRTLSLLDRLEDDSELPEDGIARTQWKDEVQRLMRLLAPIECNILRWRFGLDTHRATGDGDTLEQIGAKYGLTRERIRQLQERAIGKIRQHMLRSQLSTTDFA